jgi:alcohol dehydrogenase
MPKTGRAAVMIKPGAPLTLHTYPVPKAGAGEILVRVTCCTICGSDLLSWTGRRPAPTPLILGHEIVGEIVALGSGVTHDGGDRPLRAGDRVSWSMMDSCGRCDFCCDKGLPMKCRRLRKYGHDSCEPPPHFVGGLAEYCLLGAGTYVIRIPDGLTDEEACPANCALATVVAGWEAAALRPLERVLILGAGALGIYAAALANHSGCERIVVTDVLPHRLESVRAFGATDTLDTRNLSGDAIVRAVRDITGGRGVDAVMEVAGVPDLIPVGLRCLRTGGRFIEHGTTYPGATCTLDASELVFRWLTLRGVHNYDARHLRHGLDFLAQTKGRFPFDRLVTRGFPLEQANDALALAQSREAIRVAVRP